MSEEDGSDAEVILMETKQPALTTEDQVAEKNLKNQVGLIDSQLKALGLYEEGLSYEQKEELLAVVVASRETAEQEASMRRRAQQWQQKVVIDDAELGAKTASLSLTSSPPVIEACSSSVSDCQEISPSSQDLFEVTVSSSAAPKTHTSAEKSTLDSIALKSKETRGKRSLSTRGRGRRSSAKLQTMQATVSPMPQPTAETSVEDDDIIEVDSVHSRKDLDRFMCHWQPCGSPEAVINYDRFSSQNASRDACGDSLASAKKLLHSFEEFHVAVDKLQKKSSVFVEWGQPITVGRAYATRSTRIRGIDPENSDGIFSQQSPGVNSSSINSKDSMCASYLRLRQFSKCLDSSIESKTPSKGCKNRKLLLENPYLLASSANRPSANVQKENPSTGKCLKPENVLPSRPIDNKRKHIPLSNLRNNYVQKGPALSASIEKDSAAAPRTIMQHREPRVFRSFQHHILPPNPDKFAAKKTNALESTENRRFYTRFAKTENVSTLGQENCAEPTKRKGSSTNVKAVSSPAKRLKSASTT